VRATPFCPELDADVRRRFTGRSAFMGATQQAIFVASAGGRPVGRARAAISARWQDLHGEQHTGFIGDLAFAPGEPMAGRALIAACEDWLAGRGVERVLGGMSHMFIQYVVRTSAFDELPAYPARWDPPALAAALESVGYERGAPAWTYTLDLAAPVWRAAAAEAAARARCDIRPLDKRRWAQDFDALCAVFNDAFADEFEFQPMRPAEWRETWDPYRPIFDAENIQLAEVDGQVVGACVGGLDIAPLLQILDGRLGPVRIARFVRGRARLRQASIFLIGVRSGHRRRGIAAGLLGRLLSHYSAQQLDRVVYHLVNDENTASRALAERFGGSGRALHHRFARRLERDERGRV